MNCAAKSAPTFITAAWSTKSAAGLNPARYVAGLGAAAMRAGARSAEHTKLRKHQPAPPTTARPASA